MNLEEKHLLRRCLLAQLEAARVGLNARQLGKGAELAGFGSLPETEIIEALEWLCAKGFALEFRAELSLAVRLWKITEAGVELLDSGKN